MKAQTITYDDHAPPLKVTVGQATPFMEVHRSLRMSQALVQLAADLELQPGEPFPGSPEVPMAQFTWPNCMACVVTSEGFNHHTITLAEFAALPEQFVTAWHRAALAMNPAWRHVRPVRASELEVKDAS